MVERNRSNLIIDTLNVFNSSCNQYRGVGEGLIYSTYPIDEKTKTRIEKKISEIEKVEVELTNKIDPNLIGGIKVVYGSHVYDGTLSTQVEAMREHLFRKE